jgi:hypothetical protein
VTNDMPEIDLGDLIPSTPTIRRNAETNELSIEWDGDGPADVIISGALLEGFVTERNALVASNRAMHAVITKARLGQSINKADWESVGLTSAPARPVIDLKSRDVRPS